MQFHLKCLAFFLSAISITSAKATEFIDLSHDYSKQTLSWPTTAAFHITRQLTGPKDLYLISRDFACNEHTGTHIDAPIHFAKGHKGVSAIELTDLIGPAIKIDVKDAVKANPDYQININDFKKWEAAHGKIPSATIILLNTGYGNVWPNWKAYTGTEKTGTASFGHIHFPGLDPNAATWLVEQRKIKAIGIDTFSIDYGQTKRFESHQILTKNDIPIFENVASMDQLPADGFKIYAFPMKIQGGTGAPLRIVAEK